MHKICSVTIGIFATLLLIGIAKAQSPNTAGPMPNKNMQPCFAGQNLFGCSIRADNNPKTIGASRPASFAYTLNNDADDSFAVQAAIKTQHDIGPAFFNIKGQWNKDNQQKKEQDNLNVGIGLQFEDDNLDEVYDRWEKSGKTSSTDIWSIYLDTDVAYNRKKIFGDKTDSQCIADSGLQACGNQFLETLRFSMATAPYLSQFESQNPAPGSNLYYIFAPTLGLFYDEAFNSDVELLSGDVVNGGVFGISTGATVVVSPGVFQNKWELSLSGQIIPTFYRAKGRREDFEKTSRLFTASLSYALLGSYIGQRGDNTFIPALSITYTNGSDSLKGRESQDKVIFGLTVKY